MASCKECFHYEACLSMLEEAMGYRFDGEHEGSADRCDTFVSKADAVKVVRCKDCKFRYGDDCTMAFERVEWTGDNRYCDAGERKENE